MKSRLALATLAFALAGSSALAAPPPLPAWKHLSSRQGELPAPANGTEQTDALAFDIDGDKVPENS